MQSLDTAQLKSPIKKLVEFFRRSRDKWKAKYFVKRDESIVTVHGLGTGGALDSVSL